jgi:hypothetical protein
MRDLRKIIIGFQLKNGFTNTKMTELCGISMSAFKAYKNERNAQTFSQKHLDSLTVKKEALIVSISEFKK